MPLNGEIVNSPICFLSQRPFLFIYLFCSCPSGSLSLPRPTTIRICLELNSLLRNCLHRRICIQSRNLSSVLLQTLIYTQMRQQQHLRKILHVCFSRTLARSKVMTRHLSPSSCILRTRTHTHTHTHCLHNS